MVQKSPVRSVRGHAVSDKDGIVRRIPESRAAEFSDGLGRCLARASVSLDETDNAITKAESELTSRISAALRDPNREKPSNVANATAIREYVAKLPDDKRVWWVTKAIEVGEHDIADAILGANHYISGFDKKQANLIRQIAAEKWASREVKQLAAVTKMRGTLELAISSVFGAFKNLEPRIPAPSSQTVAMKRLKGEVV